MNKHRSRSTDASVPPCYVLVHPGLEEVAGEELKADFGADIKKTAPGVVVFRVPEIDRQLLRLKTAEDVFVLAWGTDQLSYRAADLDKIRLWTAREADWSKLLSIHHAIRPKPKGKPTFRLVVQMNGVHGYRRIDAQKSLAQGLTGKLPASWRHVEENAAIEIWLTIDGAAAVCGIRLSDRTMRHRTYKFEHFPASLRPSVAASMVRLAEIRPGQTILDPMCGAGTILAEAWLLLGRNSEKGRRGEGEKGRRRRAADHVFSPSPLLPFSPSSARRRHRSRSRPGGRGELATHWARAADNLGCSPIAAIRGQRRPHSLQSAVWPKVGHTGRDRASLSGDGPGDGSRAQTRRPSRAYRVGR